MDFQEGTGRRKNEKGLLLPEGTEGSAQPTRRRHLESKYLANGFKEWKTQYRTEVAVPSSQQEAGR